MKYNFSWDEDRHYVNVCLKGLSVDIIARTKVGHTKFSRWENVEYALDEEMWKEFEQFFAETRE